MGCSGSTGYTSRNIQADVEGASEVLKKVEVFKEGEGDDSFSILRCGRPQEDRDLRTALGY